MRATAFPNLYSLFCLFFLVSLFVFLDLSYGLTVDSVIATVNNEIITLSDYQRFVASIGAGNTRNKEAVEEALLKRLLEEKIILHEAVRRGIEASDTEVDKAIEEFKKQKALSQDDFEKMLAEEGTDINSYRKFIKDRIILSKLVSEGVDSKVVVTVKEIEDFYNTNKKDYLIPEKVEVKAIFLRLNKDASITEITDLKQKVLGIVSHLKEGDSFESLVSQYSDEPLKSRGGMLGEFERGTLIPLLDNKAFSMRKGEVSEPIWVSEGVYILKLKDKRGESYKTIEAVRKEIYENLHVKKGEKLFNEWMKTLWEKASISIKITK
jgi:parvulin-like peptidyl-prolyl isomerase